MINNEFCKKPCEECPFRKNSLKGYLGGFTIDETLRATNFDQDFICHLTRGKNEKQCAGRLLYTKNTFKMFKDSSLNEMQNKVSELNPNRKEEILGFEFREHHTINKF